MESTEAEALIRLGHPRFRNFSDAVDPVLSAISDVIPGLIALGQLKPDEQGFRVIDVRGSGIDGVAKGSYLPLGSHANGVGAPSGSVQNQSPPPGLDHEHLKALGAAACLGMPLEVSDGQIVGILCALNRDADVYGPAHEAMLCIAARLLSHEWESVERRAELRRLRRSSSADAKIDADTGLPSRDSFFNLLDHEWELTSRGTVASALVAMRIGTNPDRGLNGDPRAKLSMKIAAEVLEGSARTTDRLGRVGETTLAAILVGCNLEQASGFVERVQAALRRVTEGHGPEIEVSYGVQALAGTPSPEEAFMLAEAAARARTQHRQAETMPEGVIR